MRGSSLLRQLFTFCTPTTSTNLTEAQANLIRRTKDNLPAALLLDAGDAVSAGNVGVRPGGEPILTRMSDAGYDAMTLGNREFHVADTLLRHKISKARFPILCANIRWKDIRERRCRLPGAWCEPST